MNKEIKEAFQKAKGDLRNLHNSLLESNYESNQEVFDAALYLYETVGVLIEAIEDNDSNLDPETTNLPNLDEVFADDPVSKYVHAAIAYAQSEGSADAEAALKEAALEVAESQKELAEDYCSYPACDCPGISCLGEDDDDWEEISFQEYIELTEEEYAEVVMQNMDLIERELEDKTGFSQADLYLIRYYLKHTPDTSHYEIEGLSDSGLVAAWNQIKYKRNLK